MRSTRALGPVLLACGLSVVATSRAGAMSGPPKCAAVISRAGGAFLAARVDVIKRCEKLRLQGILAPDVDSLTQNPNAAELEGVAKDLEDAIGKACGGADQTCGTADDASLADTGWGDVTQCPDIDGSGCTNAISSCKDVTTCIECAGTAAAAQAIRLDFGGFDPSAFGLDSTTNKCQLAIGRASTKFLEVLARSLGRCEVNRMRHKLRGKEVAECMSGEDKTSGLVA